MDGGDSADMNEGMDALPLSEHQPTKLGRRH